VLVGYVRGTHGTSFAGYRVLLDDHSIATSRNVVFDESRPALSTDLLELAKEVVASTSGAAPGRCSGCRQGTSGIHARCHWSQYSQPGMQAGTCRNAGSMDQQHPAI